MTSLLPFACVPQAQAAPNYLQHLPMGDHLPGMADEGGEGLEVQLS